MGAVHPSRENKEITIEIVVLNFAECRTAISYVCH